MASTRPSIRSCSGPGAGGVTTTTQPPEFRVPSDDDPVRILVAGEVAVADRAARRTGGNGYVSKALTGD
mgnify:CR=1 FL=1